AGLSRCPGSSREAFRLPPPTSCACGAGRSSNVCAMRVRLVVALRLVLVVLGAFIYLRPIPAVSPAHLLRTSDVVPGAAPSLPWPSRGSAAVGVSGLGLLASSGNAQTFPAASVTKVMTALVILADKPLKSHEGGPTVTLTEAGVQPYQADLAGGQRVAEVEGGGE